jgi:clan AA aspartic protease
MGTFQVEIEIGDPQGERWEKMAVTVDTGSTYTVVPRTVLERLGVQPLRKARFRLANGQTFDQDVAQTWIRIDGNSAIRIIAFGENQDEPLLGADTMEGLQLAVDPVGKRLVAVDALRLRRLEDASEDREAG